MRKEREGREFGPSAKSEIRKRSKGRCVITGTRQNIQIHHLEHIWWDARHNVDKRITTHPANGVCVNAVDHNKLHNEIYSWDYDTQCNYFRAVYSHILDVIHNRVSDKLQEVKMPLYEFESENIIYQAAGD
jgi:hypothetical protein